MPARAATPNRRRATASSRSPAWSPVAALALGLTLSGCTTSRALTPWMRVSSTTHLDRQGYLVDDGHTQRKLHGRWVEEQTVGSAAGFGFDGGRRAVVGSVVWDERGPLATLDCDPRAIFAPPDENELVCVEVSAPRWKPDEPDRARFMLPVESPDTIRVTRYDRDGRRLGERRAMAPVPLAKREPLGAWNAIEFLGFRGDGLVFSVQHVTREQSFASDAPIACNGWLLRPDGGWEPLGTLHTVAGSLWECNFPSPWNRQLGLRIAFGRRVQDAHGEPRP